MIPSPWPHIGSNCSLSSPFFALVALFDLIEPFFHYPSSCSSPRELLTYDNLLLIHNSLRCTFLQSDFASSHFTSQFSTRQLSSCLRGRRIHSPNGILILFLSRSTYNSSRHLEFVSIILVRRQTCFEAFSRAPGDLPLKRSMLGRK